jgi:hypothetical protein
MRSPSLAVGVTALLPSSLPPRPGALLRGQLGHARRTSTSEAGYIAQVGLPRTTRGCTHARGSQLQLGGRSLCLVRPPRAWAHANRQWHARAQHAEAARLAAAHAAPRMHAAHARRTTQVADVPVVAEVGSSCFASRKREFHGRRRATPAVRARCAMCARTWSGAASCAWGGWSACSA